MATTSPDNIWTPDAGDDYALTTDLAATADTVQDAITDVRSGILGLAGLEANKPAFGVEGRTWYSRDTNRSWFDTGSNWISNDGGLYLIEPTSVSGSGAAISAGGVAVTGSTTFQVNGIFSSRFRNYKIVVTLRTAAGTGTNTSVPFRYVAAGTPDSGANYDSQRTYMETSTVSTALAAGDTSYSLNANSAASYLVSEVLVSNPADTLNTLTQVNTSCHRVGALARNLLDAKHATTTAFDGIQFLSSQAVTGLIKVYGYA